MVRYKNQVFYDEMLGNDKHFAYLLDGKIAAFGQVQTLNDGNRDLVCCSVRGDGEKKMKEYRAALVRRPEAKSFLAKIRGMEYHPSGEVGGTVEIPARAIVDIEKIVEKAQSLPDITTADALEISINLTNAAKYIEKMGQNPKLVDWLKNVNRKAIAIINAYENPTGKKDTL